MVTNAPGFTPKLPSVDSQFFIVISFDIAGERDYTGFPSYDGHFIA
jgi:hypothetical protein